ERLEVERRRVSEERARTLAEGLAGFERAEAELRRRVSRELEEARSETARLARTSAARLVDEAAAVAAAAEPAFTEAREAEEEAARAVEVGGPARIRALGAEGVVVSFDGDWAQMEIRGKRMRVRRSELEPAGGVSRKQKAVSRSQTEPSRSRLMAHGSRDTSGPTAEVNVIGQRVDEAIDAVEKALDQALLTGASNLRVIHGHGTGRLRDGLREHLRAHASVASMRPGGKTEGGNGATIL